jgi:hypothetical protein
MCMKIETQSSGGQCGIDMLCVVFLAEMNEENIEVDLCLKKHFEKTYTTI